MLTAKSITLIFTIFNVNCNLRRLTILVMSVMLDSLPRFHNLACIHTIKWLSTVSIYTVVVAFDTSAENKEMCSEDLVFRFVPKGSRLKVLIFILKGLFVMAN